MKKSLWVMAALLALCLTGCGQPDTSVTVTPPDSGKPETTEATDFTVTPIDPAASKELRDQAYTNVPGTPTQNAVLDYTITYFPDTAEAETYSVTPMEPDRLIVESLEDIYRFVQEEKKMPVRYFPEEVQKQVQEILKGGSVDILHISEFFGIRPELELRPEETAEGLVQLDEDYRVGQLVVVMFGDTRAVNTENLTEEELENIHWTPLPAKVKQQGQITFAIPSELLEAVEGEETLFLVLTVRTGAGGNADEEGWAEDVAKFIPSKDVGDLAQSHGSITTADGRVLPDDFRIFVREHTLESKTEISRLQRFMEQQEDTVASYFTENLRQQMALLLDGARPEELICYNANYLGAENYVDTYGDAVVRFRFSTDYPEGTEMVCMLGTLKDPQPETQSDDPVLPEESAFDWAVLRGEEKDGYVHITFPQQLIPLMEEQGALLLVLSRPITPRG